MQEEDPNSALRAKLNAGVELNLQDASIREVCIALSGVLEAQVFYDTPMIPFPLGKKVTLRLKPGVRADNALTDSLSAVGLAWTLYEGALVVSTPEETKTFVPGAAIGGPSDDVLRKDPDFGFLLFQRVEWTKGQTYKEVLAAMEKLRVPIQSRYFATFLDEKVEWTAVRTLVGHLRVFARSHVAQFKISGGEIRFDSDPAGMGKMFGAVTLRGTVANARTAAYTGNVKLYESLIAVLRKQKDLAREAVQERLEGRDDDKGREILRKMLEDLK